MIESKLAGESACRSRRSLLPTFWQLSLGLALLVIGTVPKRAAAQPTEAPPPEAPLPGSVPNRPQPTPRSLASAVPAVVVSAPALLEDRGVAYPPRALAEGFFARVEVGLVLELDAGGNVQRATLETPVGHGF